MQTDTVTTPAELLLAPQSWFFFNTSTPQRVLFLLDHSNLLMVAILIY